MSKIFVGTAHIEAKVTVNTFPWIHDSGINNLLLGRTYNVIVTVRLRLKIASPWK
jgi:hypothetical protein